MFCLLSLLFSGCLSLPLESSFENFPDDKDSYRIEIESVHVFKEELEEVSIEKQMEEILSTMLLAKESRRERLEDKVLHLDLEISEKSFLKNIDQVNSICVLYSLKDSQGNLVLKKGIFKESKETLLSSREQYRIAKRIARSL